MRNTRWLLIILGFLGCGGGGGEGSVGSGGTGATGTGGTPGAGGSGGGGSGGAGAVDGSSESPNQLALYQSGSRIKLRVGKTPDGAKDFRGWRDTTRNEDCSFGLAPDGKVRCLPSMASASQFYADAACSRVFAQAYRSQPLCGVVKYARITKGDNACTLESDSVFALGAPYQGTEFYQLNAGTKKCEPAPQTTKDSYKAFVFFPLGDIVVATEFQESAESIE